MYGCFCAGWSKQFEKDHLTTAWVLTWAAPCMLKLLSLLLFINHYFQFKLSMPKLSGTKLIILFTSFFSVYFCVVFSLWGKIPKCFFLSHRTETPHSLKWSSWFLLGKPCSCCVLANPLCLNWVHMWFAEHAIHTHFFLLKILFPLFLSRLIL